MNSIAIALIIICFIIITMGYFIKDKSSKGIMLMGGMAALIIAFLFHVTQQRATDDLEKEMSKPSYKMYQPVNEQLYRFVDTTVKK